MRPEASDKANLGANMVLRTVYLPLSMDDELRRRAFDWHKSKNEIIRECDHVALEAHADELFVESKPAEELVQDPVTPSVLRPARRRAQPAARTASVLRPAARAAAAK